MYRTVVVLGKGLEKIESFDLEVWVLCIEG